MRVAVLFACAGGPYAELGADVYDVKRDARTFDLACPVVAHPPCRAWGRLRHMAKPRADERDLAIWSVWVARHCGGIVEHPASSRLWPFMGIVPGRRDCFGGLLTIVHQDAFGHRAPKPTGFYCVRCDVPVPAALVAPGAGRVQRMCRQERERTPVQLASLLLHLARRAGGV